MVSQKKSGHIKVPNLSTTLSPGDSTEARDEVQVVDRRERVVAHVLLQAEAHTLPRHLSLRVVPHVLSNKWEQQIL